ncbi:hypothetical protein RUM43_009195 [Polyplax serrata]|uniref:Carboxylesterase type B domain-containing protein n=1 Tax=Polyplax serrata TaxID=468196 RepID=A0AAN8S1X8_POLSC
MYRADRRNRPGTRGPRYFGDPTGPRSLPLSPPSSFQNGSRSIRPLGTRLGSVRGESIIYLLGLPLVEGHPFFLQNFTKQDVTVTEAVLNYFTNFAKTGNPNEPRNQMIVDYSSSKEKPKYRGITWESYEVQSQQYLSISEYSYTHF